MKTKIISNLQIAPGYFQLAFEASFSAKPGQFVMIRADEGSDPLLRRPMSLAGCGDGNAEIIYKVVGAGTSLMSQKRAGDILDVIGPFGNYFDPPENAENILLIGGGIGISPLLFYARRNNGHSITAFIGGATKNDILMVDEFEKNCNETIVVTEDGSAGTRGLVLAPAEKFFKKGHIMSCGPVGMLKKADSLSTKLGASGEISMEEMMGCGFGVCLGCIVETRNGPKRVCVEGPVFKTGVLKWR